MNYISGVGIAFGIAGGILGWMIVKIVHLQNRVRNIERRMNSHE